jgi:hypothetical protein
MPCPHVNFCCPALLSFYPQRVHHEAAVFRAWQLDADYQSQSPEHPQIWHRLLACHSVERLSERGAEGNVGKM